MHIHTNNDALELLQSKNIPDQNAGIFKDIYGDYAWFIKVDGLFDCGSKKTFSESFDIVKNYKIKSYER
jgi:hypothetical protein